MQNKEISVGDILIDINNRKSYRVILITPELVEICELNITALKLFFVSLNMLRQQLISQEIVVEKEAENIIDLSLMSPQEIEKFEMNKEIINQIINLYGPTYEELMNRKKKIAIEHISEKYGISKETIRRLYIKYIQSGCRDYGLLDTRHTSNRQQNRKIYNYINKPGRKSDNKYSSSRIISDEVREHFDAAIEYFKSGRVKTYEAAYQWMCTQYYTQTSYFNGQIIHSYLPETEIPTMRQFRYYAKKKLSPNEIDSIKTSMREQRNDKRLLISDASYDVLGPGDLVEMDAVEVDLSLVSEVDRTKTVGRPIVYALIDVYTRMILAISISFDNNSELGLTNCFLNLCEDKVAYCSKFGIEITTDMWMSNIIPKRIRCDRGVDFRSKAFQRICKNLGIDRQLVSAATGSLKGTVEQLFRQIHVAQNVHLEDRGLIEKRYDSKHHKEALLTITEYTQILLSYVIIHNAQAIDKYPLTRDMIEQGVANTPIALWKYGCKKYGQARPISDKNQFVFDLLIPCKASLNRRGLKVNGLYYMNWDDEQLLKEMYKQQNNVMKMDIRYDPRDVGQIYYVRDGKLYIAELNKQMTGNAEYAGMTYVDLKAYQQKKKEIQSKTQKEKQHLKNSLFLINKNIVDKVDEKQTTYASAENIRENRAKEKQIISQRNNVMEHIEQEEKEICYEAKEPNENKKVKKEEFESFLEALDDFEE